ncbi:Uncharacterised protein [BD1-7 clade bacterium]|uniref:DUF2505 domain-containing protein n=1 Tax=BD1-7 clade bacterium TaxID=2029982 RepID=A0A5S9QBI4_9GAMM|nr:Uncharacterised protein [BD1-7 clade bacterium]CAA0115502.1 Uncharacterised protein [BD1-7 clade bacterium]CAA0119218.1 Uncharacterised protein [BD1-7 clade bacterium]
MSTTYKLQHDVDTVIDMLCDPDFLVERSIDLGELSADAEVEEEGSKIIISMRREVTRDLPKFLAKLFNPQQVLHLTETWQQVGDNFVGKSEFTVEGQPVKVNTDMTLKPSGDGCEYTISYKAKADIPLVGGKVEKFIVSNCEEGTQKEIDFLTKRLAG